jgi:hypothetical protein
MTDQEYLAVLEARLRELEAEIRRLRDGGIVTGPRGHYHGLGNEDEEKK